MFALCKCKSVYGIVIHNTRAVLYSQNHAKILLVHLRHPVEARQLIIS